MCLDLTLKFYILKIQDRYKTGNTHGQIKMEIIIIIMKTKLALRRHRVKGRGFGV